MTASTETHVLLRDVTFAPSDTDATEFTLSYWKADRGQRVDEGAELVVVESVDEKTAIAMPSPFTGVLVEIVAREDDLVRPGDVLGRIDVD